jgi:hypothetical protein
MSQPDFRAQTMVVRLEKRVLALENRPASSLSSSSVFDAIRLRCVDDGAIKEVKLRLDGAEYVLEIVQ